MDYSMLVAVHNLDQAARDKLQGSKEKSGSTQLLFVVDQHETTPVTSPHTLGESPVPKRDRRRTPQRQTYSIVSDDSGDRMELESVGATAEPFLPRFVSLLRVISFLFTLMQLICHQFDALIESLVLLMHARTTPIKAR
jgi:hypothetical protein